VWPRKARSLPSDTPDPAHARAFVPDTPLTDPSLDRFKRNAFACRVAKTLALRTDPSSIVVLIHGAWGEGKTTVLEFIERELQTFDHVVPVKFNPWRVTDEASLRNGPGFMRLTPRRWADWSPSPTSGNRPTEIQQSIGRIVTWQRGANRIGQQDDRIERAER